MHHQPRSADRSCKRDARVVQAGPRREQLFAFLPLSPSRNNVFCRCNRPFNPDLISRAQRMLQHDDTIRAFGYRRAGHNRHCLPSGEMQTVRGHGPSLDLSNNVQSCGHSFNISGTDGVTVSRGPWKGRKVTVSVNLFREYPSGGIE
jgi:hypothetical protein